MSPSLVLIKAYVFPKLMIVYFSVRICIRTNASSSQKNSSLFCARQTGHNPASGSPLSILTSYLIQAPGQVVPTGNSLDPSWRSYVKIDPWASSEIMQHPPKVCLIQAILQTIKKNLHNFERLLKSGGTTCHGALIPGR